MIGIALFLLAGHEKPWDNRHSSAQAQTKGGYNVELVGWVDSVGEVSSLAASEDGRVVYASAGDTPFRDSLVVIDISNPTNPLIYKRIGHDSLGCLSVTTVEDFLYVWWGGYGSRAIYIYEIWVMDISDPLNPAFSSCPYHYEGPIKPDTMWGAGIGIHDTVLYGFGSIAAVDVSEPGNPTLISAIGGGGAARCFCYPYAFTTWPAIPYSWWYAYDLSDPSDMFLVHRDSVYEVYEPPSGIAAWEYNGKRYLYLHGGTFDYSFDVTDPTNPIQLNWGNRENPRIHEGIVRGTRYYASATGPEFVVLDLTDPVYEPIIAWYNNEVPLCGVSSPFIWVNGYVVAEVSVSSPRRHGLVIYHYKYDTIPVPEDTSVHYLEWVRTIYGRPEISFSLKSQAKVSFSLFNSAGQKAHERDLGTLSPGPHTVSLPGLKPGVYFLELRIDKRVISRKIIFTTQEGGFKRDDNPSKQAETSDKVPLRTLLHGKIVKLSIKLLQHVVCSRNEAGSLTLISKLATRPGFAL